MLKFEYSATQLTISAGFCLFASVQAYVAINIPMDSTAYFPWPGEFRGEEKSSFD